METQLVKCISEGTYIVHGQVSGNRYQFVLNQTLPVDIRDITQFSSLKEVSGGCCGHPRIERNIFEIIQTE